MHRKRMGQVSSGISKGNKCQGIDLILVNIVSVAMKETKYQYPQI